MGKYKIEHSKVGSDWTCNITNRVNGEYGYGKGSTKKEATDEAWDNYYGINKNSNYNIPRSTYTWDDVKDIFWTVLIIIVLYFLIIKPIFGYFGSWTYYQGPSR